MPDENKTKLWAVIGSVPYEGEDALSVWDNEADALAEVERLQEARRATVHIQYEFFHTQEMELNRPYEISKE